MAEQPQPDTAHRRSSETEQVLQAILESYWQALVAAITAGDQMAIDRSAACIAHLTGRSVAGAEIPDVPTGLTRKRSG
jgi:hypothetical protein